MSLYQQLLTETEDRLNIWKSGLIGTLGPNGQYLIELMPEMEQLIGRQTEMVVEAQKSRHIAYPMQLKVF